MAAQSTRSYRDLIVWQRAIQLCVAIYELTRAFPQEEIYGLTNQLRRASISIASNIAEGCGRLTREQYRHFLGIAKGSNFEVETQLEIAGRVGLGDVTKIEHAAALSSEIGKMLTVMLREMPANHRAGILTATS
jgi:four helix bundle protein